MDNVTVTVTEFQMWLDGFIAGREGQVLPQDIELIRTMAAKVQQTVKIVEKEIITIPSPTRSTPSEPWGPKDPYRDPYRPTEIWCSNGTNFKVEF